MSELGIYFGPKIISLVEVKGNKIVHKIQIPQPKAAGSDFEEKVPEEVRVVALFKEELRRGNIEVKEACISVLGKDLIIRTFDLPMLPQEELRNAVNFEVRKYIPFKVEELISDYCVRVDRPNRRNLVLFVGIKKDIIERYISILGQLNIKPSLIEYSAFSFLRLFKLAHAGERGVVAVVNTDLAEEDEVNFIVLENGFPLFSRDIILAGEPSIGATDAQRLELAGAFLDKLKAELRISLDFYHRKFPAKGIEKVYFVSSDEHRVDLEAFIKDKGLSFQFVDLRKYIGKSLPFSMSLFKAYGCALSRAVKTAFKLDLFTVKARAKPQKEGAAGQEAVFSLFTDIKIEPKILALGLVICILAFGLGIYQKMPLQKELNSVISARPNIANVKSDATYEELDNISSGFRKKIITLDGLIKKQLYLTEILDSIPKLVSEGVWLTSFSFTKDDEKAALTLQGMAYLADSDKEFQAINDFVAKLQENPQFTKYFKYISLVSIEQSEVRKTTVSNFTIACRSFK